MKKQKFLLGAAGLLALGLTACSNELPVQEIQTAEADETRYIAIQVSAPRDAGTRAFENGATKESYINRLDFFFYDAAGNPTSIPVSMSASDVNDSDASQFQDNASGNNVTRIYKTVVGARLTQGQNLPSQVICIVNGVEANINDLKTVNLTQLIEKTRDTYRNGNYFVMSNSVYYGQDVLSGQADQRLCATPINANSQLFGTVEAAQEALKGTNANALVDIYVERLAAKVGLNMPANAVTGYVLRDGANTANTVTINFKPEYWAMNATDEKVYLTKRYGVESGNNIEMFPDYSDINQALTDGGFTNWNDNANFRSYWGCSPSYFANDYPDVSDDVNDLDGNVHDYNIYYYSYKDISETESTKGNIGAQAIKVSSLPEDAEEGETLTNYFSATTTTVGTETTSTGYIYTRETTVAKNRINNIATGNPAAAVASAVVVGKYYVGDATTASTFYVDRNAGTIGTGAAARTAGTYYATEEAAIAKLANRQAIVFTDEQGTTPAAADRFVMKHPVKAVRDLAGTKLAGRLVTIQLENLTGSALYYYDINANNGDGGYVQINGGNINAVNAQLLSVGYMDMFADGLAFYSVPIRHLNWKNAWYTENANGGGTYDWAAMQSGSLGVVRNHVYNLTISTIKGLGTGLRSVDQPIVPAKEEADQYIAARLNILAWNIVTPWTVNL